MAALELQSQVGQAVLGVGHLAVEHGLVVLVHLDKAIMVAATVVLEFQAAAAAALVL